MITVCRQVKGKVGLWGTTGNGRRMQSLGRYQKSQRGHRMEIVCKLSCRVSSSSTNGAFIRYRKPLKGFKKQRQYQVYFSKSQIQKSDLKVGIPRDEMFYSPFFIFQKMSLKFNKISVYQHQSATYSQLLLSIDYVHKHYKFVYMCY